MTRGLNWARLRGIGAFPLFQVSYAALAVSILMITSTGWLNKTRVITVLEYPIELPDKTMYLFASSILLAVGSTLYRLKCPARVQEFSEVQWVEQHRYPRLQYLAESLSRPWQIETAVITGIGGVGALYLVGDRVYVALRYILAELGIPLWIGLTVLAAMAVTVLWRPIRAAARWIRDWHMMRASRSWSHDG